MTYKATPLLSRDAFVVQRAADGHTRLVTALDIVLAASAEDAIEAAFARPPAGDLEADRPVVVAPVAAP